MYCTLYKRISGLKHTFRSHFPSVLLPVCGLCVDHILQQRCGSFALLSNSPEIVPCITDRPHLDVGVFGAVTCDLAPEADLTRDDESKVCLASEALLASWQQMFSPETSQAPVTVPELVECKTWSSAYLITVTW